MRCQRRVDPRRIKIHRSYTVEQLAQLLGRHKNSVRLWLKQGLEPLEDGKRPLLIQGAVARRFLEAKRQSRKRRCQTSELYCFRCQEPRTPTGLRAVCVTNAGQAPQLIATCSECGARMFKRISARILPSLEQSSGLEISGPEETPRLAA